MLVDVKICGLTRPSDAEAAADVGARWVGVVFAAGPRRLSTSEAAKVLARVPSGVGRVGVFGRTGLATILEAVESLGLDAVQLHTGGTERVRSALTERGVSVWRVVRLRGRGDAHRVAPMAVGAAVLLAEPRVAGRAGGAGVPLDLNLALEARRALPSGVAFALAGGLRPETVREAVRVVRPSIVDVSSGVEARVGVKDPGRMLTFVREATDDAA